MADVMRGPVPAGEIPGLVRLDRRQRRIQRAVVLLLTVGPLVGLALAIATLWGGAIGGVELGVMLGTYLASGIGITVGFHRLLTHRSFDAPNWLRGTFAVLGSMAIEGSVISWVADHRRHHAFADKEGDPHSPHLDEHDGIAGALRGLWHAHVGWLMDDERTDRERWAPDLLKDPMMRRIDRAFPWFVVASLAGPAVLGLVLTGTIGGAFTTFLWGGLARVFLLHHVTWSVNSICHFFGSRPYETPDESTNNWPLALISFGESWHNNHHAFPTSARHGLKRTEPDIGGAVIGALERLGLVTNVRMPSEKQRVEKSH